jgi:hypothetical protein
MCDRGHHYSEANNVHILTLNTDPIRLTELHVVSCSRINIITLTIWKDVLYYKTVPNFIRNTYTEEDIRKLKGKYQDNIKTDLKNTEF